MALIRREFRRAGDCGPQPGPPSAASSALIEARSCPSSKHTTTSKEMNQTNISGLTTPTTMKHGGGATDCCIAATLIESRAGLDIWDPTTQAVAYC